MPRTALAEGIAALATKPVMHGDKGDTLKATTVLTMLNWLGVTPSYSRPHWSHIEIVALNPERDSVITAHLRSIDTQPLAA